MARAHLDHVIKPAYVREVCRLLRNSNITISRKDIEVDEVQKEINLVQRDRRENEQEADYAPDQAVP